MINAEFLKLTGAFLLFIVGIAGFYLMPFGGLAGRISVVVVAVFIAIALAWFSTTRRVFGEYVRESIREVEKVVWPTKKETWQVTLFVFIFATTLALFMWLVDSGLAWLFYDVLLKRAF